jgi:hypothetical protein
MSYQSTNQSSLDKLMQMATLEQLNNMIHQMNKNMNANTNETKDILSLPIVQKVVMAYEDELKIKQSNNCCSCDCQKQVNDYIPLFDTILSKMNEQYHHYNSNLLRVETKVDELFAFLDRSERQERQRQDNIQEIDRSQLKLTDFSSFFRKYAVIDLTVTSEAATSEATTSEAATSEATTSETIETFIPIKEENITLKIEEKDMSDAEDSDDVTEDDDHDDAVSVAVEDPHVTRLIIEEDEDLNDDEVSDEEAVEDKEAIEDEALDEDPEAVSEDVEDEAVSVEDEEVSEEESEEEVRTEDEEEEEKDEVKEQEEEVDEPEDEDEEVFEIEIDDVTYFATDEENGILYEVDNGEVGRKVGIIKDGEPIFS